MAVNKSGASQGKKTHYSKPSSKLSKQSYITKPESREVGSKMNVAAADRFINKIF